MKKIKSYLATGILGLALALSGCEKGNSDNLTPQPTNKDRTINGWGEASKSDIDRAKTN